MNKAIIMFVMLLGGFTYGQTFCFDPNVKAQQLVDGYLNESWVPEFSTQKSNFTQTRSFETISTTRNVVITKTGGDTSCETQVESEIVGEISGNVGADLNGDGDMDDVWKRCSSTTAIYTASIGGSHVVTSASTDQGWILVTNN